MGPHLRPGFAQWCGCSARATAHHRLLVHSDVQGGPVLGLGWQVTRRGWAHPCKPSSQPDACLQQ